MIQKIKQPAGMVVHQIRNVIVSGREAGSETGSETGAETKAEMKTAEVDEKLVYGFSGKFRSDIVSSSVSRFDVESNSQFIKVAVMALIICNPYVLVAIQAKALKIKTFELIGVRKMD